MRNKFFLLLVAGVGLVLTGAGCQKTTLPTTSTDESAAMREETMQKETGAMMEKMEGDAMVQGDVMVKNETMTDSMMKDGTMTKDEAMKDDKKDEAMMKASGSYEDYAASKLAWANDGKVVLFFKASWCPTCQSVDKNILANLGEIPANTHILKVDYDTSGELKKKYGVTYQHTFVQVNAQGNLIKKWSGSPSLTALTAEIK